MYQTNYFLMPDDVERFQEWDNEHSKTCKFAPTEENPFAGGAIGGRLTFSFTPTSIGTFANVTCACGEKIELTDCSDW